jgi:hypothetical protein
MWEVAFSDGKPPPLSNPDVHQPRASGSEDTEGEILMKMDMDSYVIM